MLLHSPSLVAAAAVAAARSARPQTGARAAIASTGDGGGEGRAWGPRQWGCDGSMPWSLPLPVHIPQPTPPPPSCQPQLDGNLYVFKGRLPLVVLSLVP